MDTICVYYVYVYITWPHVAGPKYWMVQKLKMKSYGGSIYDYGFPTTVKKIDAAVHLREYKKTYFFTGHVYYRYVGSDVHFLSSKR